MTRAIRATGSAALAAALMAALHLGTASGQKPDAEESSATSIEESEIESAETVSTTDESTAAEPTTDDSDLVESTTAEPPSVKRSKKASTPFKPTERIEAESVISFPANI